MSKHVTAIKKIAMFQYHVEVEFRSRIWPFPEKVWRQQYRGSMHTWKRYPQGDDLPILSDLADWLEQYCQQYEWSKER